MKAPCERCPWRVANHGKPTPWHFYNAKNLRRLWNQIRGGGAAQSCHPTDPRHPDHIAAGARPDSTPQECLGAVILVLRECRTMASYSPNHEIDNEAAKVYLARNRDGLTKTGILYWLVGRQVFGHVPIVGNGPLPAVNIDEPGIDRWRPK